MLEKTVAWAEAMAAWMVDVGVAFAMELVGPALVVEPERLCW